MVCRGLLFGQVIILFGVFISRNVFSYTPPWGDPLAILFSVWMSVMSSVIVVRSDDHIRITAFDHKLPKKVLIALDVLSVTVISAFAAFMIFKGIPYVATTARNNIAGLNISVLYMNIVIPVSGVLYILALLSYIMRRIRECRQA